MNLVMFYSANRSAALAQPIYLQMCMCIASLHAAQLQVVYLVLLK